MGIDEYSYDVSASTSARDILCVSPGRDNSRRGSKFDVLIVGPET